MTALMDDLRRLIARVGPISVADYMALALGHPEHGYYMTRDPVGADFITAPEVSQMFGEIVGAWFIQAWRDAGAPAPFAFVELGPGRGTLMSDMCRVASKLAPDFMAAARLHLVETSPVLRARQRDRLGAAATWHERLEDVPDLPLFLIANEFFDALPVHQYVATAEGWRERCVGLAPNGETLIFALAADAPPRPAEPDKAGTLTEISLAAAAVMEAVAARLAARRGAALIVDYGYETGSGDSLQAMRAHRFVDPLAEPGAADLTAHVDFSALKKAAGRGGAAAHGPMPQGEFLRRLGIVARAEKLSREGNGAQAALIGAALHRLIAGDAMGLLFKALAVTPQDAPAPAGFDA